MKKTAYILGCGKSGKAVCQYLSRKGLIVVGIDVHADQLRKETAMCGFSLIAEKEFASFSPSSLLVKSPGISWDHPIVRRAREENIPVTSEMELGLRAIKERGKKAWAITGSNGKTTTTLLVEHILKHAGKKVASCGNVGVPVLSCIDQEAECFVVEVSSFQLEMLEGPFFEGGLILNITDNHLDRYPSFEEYASAKFRLRNCLKKEGPLFVGNQVLKRFKNECANACLFPLFAHQEKIASLLTSSYEKTWIAPHDVENLQAAFAITSAFQIPEEIFWSAVESFEKPPHRIEFIAKKGGVDYINDSKATSVDAVSKAIKSMKKPTILIVGGVDKGGDYKEWIPFLEGKVRCVLAIGEAKKRIAESLSSNTQVVLLENLGEAIHWVSKEAKNGECVLLSPGCSSYDQFRNYEERGNTFKELVKKLAF